MAQINHQPTTDYECSFKSPGRLVVDRDISHPLNIGTEIPDEMSRASVNIQTDVFPPVKIVQTVQIFLCAPY